MVYAGLEKQLLIKDEIEKDREKLAGWKSALVNIELFTSKKELQKEIEEKQVYFIKNQEKLNSLCSSIDESRKNFYDKVLQSDEQIEKAYKMLAEVKALLTESEKLDDLGEDIKKIDAEKTAVDNALLDVREELQAVTTALEQIGVMLEEDEKRKETIKTELEEIVSAQRVEGLMKEIESLDAVCKKHHQIFDGEDQSLLALKDEIMKLNQEKSAVETQIASIENNISQQVSLSGVTTANFERVFTAKVCAYDHAKEKIDYFANSISQLRIENEERIELIEKSKKEIEKNKLQVQEIKNHTLKMKKMLEINSTHREEDLGENFLAELVASIQIGDECPVCRGDVVQKNFIEKNDLSHFDYEKSQILAEIERLDGKEKTAFLNMSPL